MDLPKKAKIARSPASRSSSPSSAVSKFGRGRTKTRERLSLGSRHSSLPPRSSREGSTLPFRGPKSDDSQVESPESMPDRTRPTELQGMEGDLYVQERVILVSGHRDPSALQSSFETGGPQYQSHGTDRPSSRFDGRKELAASKIRDARHRTSGKGAREVQKGNASRPGRASVQGNNGSGAKSQKKNGGNRDFEFRRRSSSVSSTSSLSSARSAGLSVTSPGISHISASAALESRNFATLSAAVLNKIYLTFSDRLRATWN